MYADRSPCGRRYVQRISPWNISHVLPTGWMQVHAGSYAAALELVGSTKVLRACGLGPNGGDILLATHVNDTLTELSVIRDMHRDDYQLRNSSLCANAGQHCLLVDIGGHIGTAAIIFAMHQAAARPRVLTFEPSFNNQFYLLWNLHLNGVTRRVTLIKGGVASSDGTMNVTYNAQDTTGTSRYIRPAVGSRVMDRQEATQSRTLGAALAEHGLVGNIDAVKLDCEGCEYEALPTWDSNLTSRFGRVFGEIHPWIGKRVPNGTMRMPLVHAAMCRMGWSMLGLDSTSCAMVHSKVKRLFGEGAHL